MTNRLLIWSLLTNKNYLPSSLLCEEDWIGKFQKVTNFEDLSDPHNSLSWIGVPVSVVQSINSISTFYFYGTGIDQNTKWQILCTFMPQYFSSIKK